MKQFRIQDCALIARTAGIHPAVSLRELRTRIEICPTASLYHHFSETRLRPSFDDAEFSNDFAVWSARSLRDYILAERLGMINPFDYESLDDLRERVLDVIDDRLAESAVVPSARLDDLFHFMQAMTIVFDTGKSVGDPAKLPNAIHNMTTGSIHYHFIEARRRCDNGRDDLSNWLLPLGESAARASAALRAIDIHFLTLRELKERILNTVRAHCGSTVTA